MGDSGLKDFENVAEMMADIGAQANIGAGTITCNYDGVMKHRTSVGQGAFIGSNTRLEVLVFSRGPLLLPPFVTASST